MDMPLSAKSSVKFKNFLAFAQKALDNQIFAARNRVAINQETTAKMTLSRKAVKKDS